MLKDDVKSLIELHINVKGFEMNSFSSSSRS